MGRLSPQEKDRAALITSTARQQEGREYLPPKMLWGLLTVVLMSVIGWGVLSLLQQTPLRSPRKATTASRLPVYGVVPDFSLIDQQGHPVRKADLLGKLWITSFIFTSCPDECPLMTAEMAQLQSDLAHIPGLRLISISVDPEHDIPAVLAHYAERFNADPSRWLFLTGDKRAIYRLVRDGFRLGLVDPAEPSHPSPVKDSALDGSHQFGGSYQMVDRSPPISLGEAAAWPQKLRRWLYAMAPAAAFAHHGRAKDPLHSTRFVLIDRRAQIRGYYESQEEAALQRLRQHIQMLAREA